MMTRNMANKVLIAASGLMVSMMAHAGLDDVAVSASGGLSNFKVKLESLAPGNAGATWIEYGDPALIPGINPTGFVYADGQLSYPNQGPAAASHTVEAYFPGMPASEPIDIRSTDGLAYGTVNASTMSSGVALTGADVAGLAPRSDWRYEESTGWRRIETIEVHARAGSGSQHSLPSSYGGGWSGEVFVYPESLSRQSVDFVISPHTTMVVEAQLDASVFMDPDVATGWQGAMGYQTWLTSSASMSLSRAEPLGPFERKYASESEYQAAARNLFAVQSDIVNVVWVQNDSRPTLESRLVSLSLVNDSDAPLAGQLKLDTAAFISLSRPTAVPEAGTWAMLGLGLAGIAWRQRVRQRQA